MNEPEVWRAINHYRDKVKSWIIALERGDGVSERSMSQADAELDAAISRALHAPEAQ